jgi:hypothetical protein
VIREVNLRSIVLVNRPKAALSDEGARGLVLDRPHRIAELGFHRVPGLDGSLSRLHGCGWCRREVADDLRVGHHREVRLRVAGLERAD